VTHRGGTEFDIVTVKLTRKQHRMTGGGEWYLRCYIWPWLGPLCRQRCDTFYTSGFAHDVMFAPLLVMARNRPVDAKKAYSQSDSQGGSTSHRILKRTQHTAARRGQSEMPTIALYCDWNSGSKLVTGHMSHGHKMLTIVSSALSGCRQSLFKSRRF